MRCMETRFAGSQRLDERRRRRLAVESEAAPEPAAASADGATLCSPPDRTWYAHTHPSAETSAEDTHLDATRLIESPLASLIPAAWWKHVLCVLAALALGAGILSANFQAGEWSRTLGPGVTRLFGRSASPVADWYGSLLLFAAAQVALLIWWVRSRSMTDFDGRYRIWTRVAAVWFGFSFCVACGAHRAVSEMVAVWLPERIPHQMILVWLVPSCGVGMGIVGALHREMRGCRASLGCLFAAALLYLCAGAAALGAIKLATVSGLAVLEQGILLAAHVLLLESMLLHARHVLYHTAEPTEIRRRRFTIPRPHIRWPSLGRTRSSTEPKPDPAPEPVTPRKSRIRLDGRHTESPANSAPFDKAPPVAATASAPQTEPPGAVAAGTPKSAHKSADALPGPPSPAVKNVLPDARESDSESEDDTDGGGDGDEWTDDSSGPRDLKGLSKKQRRRLLQEQRDRDRNARR